MSVVRNHVPKIYKDIKNELFAQLADKPIIGALITDGWRKKAAQQGVPLINAMVAPPDGGAFFWKVRVTAGSCFGPLVAFQTPCCS
jgi:hypothetical protein